MIAIIVAFFSRTGNPVHIIARMWSKSILFVSGIKVDVEGLEAEVLAGLDALPETLLPLMPAPDAAVVIRSAGDATAQEIVLVLDRLKRGFNVGKIFRSAEAFGAAAATLGGLDLVIYAAGVMHQVDFTDPDILPEYITYPSPGGTGDVRAYQVKPANAPDKLPAVLVIHENRGLNPHIQDVARRMALEGFLGFAPDALSPVGGTPADEDKAREMIYELDPDATVARLAAAVPFLAAHEGSTGKVGAAPNTAC